MKNKMHKQFIRMKVDLYNISWPPPQVAVAYDCHAVSGVFLLLEGIKGRLRKLKSHLTDQDASSSSEALDDVDSVSIRADAIGELLNKYALLMQFPHQTLDALDPCGDGRLQGVTRADWVAEAGSADSLGGDTEEDADGIVFQSESDDGLEVTVVSRAQLETNPFGVTAAAATVAAAAVCSQTVPKSPVISENEPCLTGFIRRVYKEPSGKYEEIDVLVEGEDLNITGRSFEGAGEMGDAAETSSVEDDQPVLTPPNFEVGCASLTPVPTNVIEAELSSDSAIEVGTELAATPSPSLALTAYPPLEAPQPPISPSSSSSSTSTGEEFYWQALILVSGYPAFLSAGQLEQCFADRDGVVAVKTDDDQGCGTATIYLRSLTCLRLFVLRNSLDGDFVCRNLMAQITALFDVPCPTPVYWRIVFNDRQTDHTVVFFRILRLEASVPHVMENRHLQVTAQLKAAYTGAWHVHFFLPDDPDGGCVVFDRENQSQADELIQNGGLSLSDGSRLVIWEECNSVTNTEEMVSEGPDEEGPDEEEQEMVLDVEVTVEHAENKDPGFDSEEVGTDERPVVVNDQSLSPLASPTQPLSPSNSSASEHVNLDGDRPTSPVSDQHPSPSTNLTQLPSSDQNLTRPHSSDSDCTRLPRSNHERTRQPSSDSDCTRPSISDSDHTRLSDSDSNRPLSSVPNLTRQLSSNSENTRPSTSGPNLTKPPSLDSDLNRPPSSHYDQTKPPSSDSDLQPGPDSDQISKHHPSKPKDPNPSYDVFQPRVQRLWRSLVTEALQSSLDNTPLLVVDLLCSFVDYPGDLPVKTNQIALFLKHDMEVDNEELVAVLVRGLADVREKLEEQLERDKRAGELTPCRDPVPRPASARTSPHRYTSPRPLSACPSSSRQTSPRPSSPRPSSPRPSSPRPSSPKKFASQDFRLSMPSFDSHVRQRKWRDAISQTLRFQKLSRPSFSIVTGLIKFPGPIPYEDDKLRKFIVSNMKIKPFDLQSIDEAIEFLGRVRSRTFTVEELEKKETAMVSKVTTFETGEEILDKNRGTNDSVGGAAAYDADESSSSPSLGATPMSPVVDYPTSDAKSTVHLTPPVTPTDPSAHHDFPAVTTAALMSLTPPPETASLSSSRLSLSSSASQHSFHVVVNDIPDFVTIKELDYHFAAIADETVEIVLNPTEGDFNQAEVHCQSFKGLLRTLNTFPLPLLWPDLQLRVELPVKARLPLPIIGVNLSAGAKFGDDHLTEVQQYFSQFGPVAAVNFHHNMQGVYVIFSQKDGKSNFWKKNDGRIKVGENLFSFA